MSPKDLASDLAADPGPAIWPPEPEPVCTDCQTSLASGVPYRRCSGCLAPFCQDYEMGVCIGCESWVCNGCTEWHACPRHRSDCNPSECYCHEHDA